MTVHFDTYPAGRDIFFLRASLEDVQWLMSKYPAWWISYPGSGGFPSGSAEENQFREIYRGRSRYSNWLRLLQPQNYDHRYLFVDVDCPGWIALLVDCDYSGSFDMGQGLCCAIAQRDGFPASDDPLGIAEIEVRYRLREPCVDFAPYGRGDWLRVGVSSTTIDSEWIEDRSYYKEMRWTRYGIDAKGLPGFEGLDVPLIAEIPDYIRQQYLPYVTEGQFERFFMEPRRRGYGDNAALVDEYQRVLPFDHRGRERVVEFFNTRLVSAWLNDTYGIRWDDPSFYDGESLLYVVGRPGVDADPFTARIPLEEYYRFQAIDPERNRALLARGKF